MKSTRKLGIVVLLMLLLLSLGSSAWLWTERSSIQAESATTQAQFDDLTDQVTKSAEVQDQNRQLQDQVNDLQQQLQDSQRATPLPDQPTPPAVPVDPALPTPTPGGSTDPGPGGVEPPADVLARIKEIEQQVIARRGLPETRPVTRRFLTRAELRDYIVGEMDKESTPDEYRHNSQELWLLGLGPRDLDLRTLLIDLQTEQIAGFYDPETKTFYLIGEEATLPPIDQITYAHEFNHNLQDQLIDLNAGLDAGEYDSDRGLAFRALVEGDATELMTQWLQDDLLPALSPQEIQQMLVDLQEQQNGSSVLDSAPAIIRESLLFPYQEGQTFVQALYEQGGWPAVTAALQDPPTSSEQILHPEKYLSTPRDEPNLPDRFDLSSVLGAGWTTATTSTLGEFDLRVLLRETAAQGNVDAAATGIGGIRYALYEQTEAQTPLLQMTLRWDTPADGDEFLTAFRSTLQPRGDLFARDDMLVAIKGAGQEYTLLFSPDEGALRTAFAAQP